MLSNLVICLTFQQIGSGNFSSVFKVLKRIDGSLYAVKHGTKQLHQDAERLLLLYFSIRLPLCLYVFAITFVPFRRKALMEVQCLAALGL